MSQANCSSELLPHSWPARAVFLQCAQGGCLISEPACEYVRPTGGSHKAVWRAYASFWLLRQAALPRRQVRPATMHTHARAPSAFVAALTPRTPLASARKTCRKLDAVKVIGSDKVTEMWTRDVPLIKNEQFKEEFKAAVDSYILGDWTTAMQKLKQADAVRSHVLAHSRIRALRNLNCTLTGVVLLAAPAERPTHTSADGHHFADGNHNRRQAIFPDFLPGGLARLAQARPQVVLAAHAARRTASPSRLDNDPW